MRNLFVKHKRSNDKMDEKNRAAMIEALARSAGLGDAFMTLYGNAKFNPETGTIYCNGHVISRETVENAKNYCEGMARHYWESTDSDARNMALIFETAAEAIKFMQDQTINKDGKKA